MADRAAGLPAADLPSPPVFEGAMALCHALRRNLRGRIMFEHFSGKPPERLSGKLPTLRAGADPFLPAAHAGSLHPLARAACNPAANPNVLAASHRLAADYTRVTLESDAAIKYSHFTLKNLNVW